MLYPLQYLGFKFVSMTSWAQLPHTLLQLERDLKHKPRIFEAWQDHNTKLWARVKTRLQEQILIAISGGRSGNSEAIDIAGYKVTNQSSVT